MARIVATLLWYYELIECRRLTPVSGRKVSIGTIIIVSPSDKFVASSDGSAFVTTRGVGVSLKSVRVNACQNCQSVVHQLRLLVTGMTYRRKIVLFPLRTESVIKLTQLMRMRLRMKKGELKLRIKIMLCEKKENSEGTRSVGTCANTSYRSVTRGSKVRKQT